MTTNETASQLTKQLSEKTGVMSADVEKILKQLGIDKALNKVPSTQLNKLNVRDLKAAIRHSESAVAV
jgi:hypothetical protein